MHRILEEGKGNKLHNTFTNLTVSIPTFLCLRLHYYKKKVKNPCKKCFYQIQNVDMHYITMLHYKQ